eukprot:CAMPEP_0197174394 /NCGR_PEP_ID=MMETSP1423-20130617/934_1 /TAXON_ID=476441 /ORGANISM="Pseudo-nitzschia heimii, Strain UNC1101" /LENGTH=1332 /DNA_ID=CAMNT_0042623319 /DNA_START=300 /DNA_END=4298 /DNA_ORIENTATION=-
MATSGKSSSVHTILNHVELSTNPTEEGKRSESSFSKVDAGKKEESITKSRDQKIIRPNIATSATSSLRTTLLAEPETTETSDLPVRDVKADPETEFGEGKKMVPKGGESVLVNVADLKATNDLVETGLSANPMPVLENSLLDFEMQRSKSDGEVNAVSVAETLTSVHPSGSSGSSQIRVASVDDASHLQDLLSSQEGNNQIVERSPGERYVRFSEKLGSGASKDVYRAYDTQEGIEVAWNVVHLAGVPKNERNRIVNEVRLLERLHHQNIISFHGSWINREQQQVNFVTEILSSGTLKSFIKKVQVIRWKIAKRWAVQILKGLEYLHSQEPPVIHRDLKCENIFINGTSGDLRIGDLGLSTVHRNGKALSVLGTPEFMAPDMYEEGSYDEKVDIYAFGMCLLEIFTKEIPYKECNNPAQIYKKVTRGAPPDSLSRLKSTHGRKFIELCLGYRKEDGKYVRPSAKELLDHPFLVKRSVDDEEVEVDPPLTEQIIIESGTRSTGRSSIESRATNANTSTSASTSHSHSIMTPNKDISSTIRHNLRSDSLEEDESDRFEEMPDSEVNNMKKVKVMMGRDEELKEDDVVTGIGHNEKRNTMDVNTSVEVGSISSLQNAQQNNDTNGKKLHYLVAAAVIEENEQTNSYQQQPYHDDILKLVITLPVEGQTQNVQFDFDLVEDGPIQVAKEMVAELGIPEEAVLEISETVSGLARVARTKKHKFNSSKPQQNPGHMRTNSIMGSRPNANPKAQVGQTAAAQQQPQQHIAQGMMQSSNQQQSIQDFIPTQQQQLQQSSSQSIQQSISQSTLSLQDQSVSIHGQPIIESNPITSQMPHLQAQRSSIQSGDSETHRQAQSSYVQASMEMSSQMDVQNHSRQRQQNQINGEYHQQGHISSETKQPRAPYGQSPVPPTNPSIPMANNSSQSNRSQMPQQRPSQQAHATLEAQSNGSGGNYPQAAPNRIQSQPVQYPPNRVQQPSGHVAQAGGSGQQAMGPSLQPPQHLQNQPLHNISQGLSQGYTQHQQLQTSIQRAQSLTQQQQLVQQMPNISQQQHMQNVVQQQQPMQLMNRQSTLPQQQLQQSITTQQHQIQQGRSQQLEHHHQQQSMAQQHSGHVQNQQQHQSNSAMTEYQMSSNQVPPLGQRIPTSANPMSLSLPQEISSPGEYGSVSHSKKTSHRRIQDGSVSSPTDASATTNSRPRKSSLEKQREENCQGEAVGVLEGLSIDTSGEEDPVDDVCSAELRKLDEDFQNNLKRAKKVFVNRMDNLQRTQVQREAQHQKTLEQHQKDRTAFEKRLQQEEIEQNRRIEQMQKEWDRRREEVRLKDKNPASNSSHAHGSSI